MRGLLIYNQKEAFVDFDKKPTLDVSTNLWDFFICSFLNESDKDDFLKEKPKTITLKRMMDNGYALEIFELSKIKEIIPSIKNEVFISFQISYLLN